MIRAALSRRRADAAPHGHQGAGMTVLVGSWPTSEGEAVFTAGLDGSRRRGEQLRFLDSPRGGAPVSTDAAPEQVA
jgi:hypothetical protein